MIDNYIHNKVITYKSSHLVTWLLYKCSNQIDRYTFKSYSNCYHGNKTKQRVHLFFWVIFDYNI